MQAWCAAQTRVTHWAWDLPGCHRPPHGLPSGPLSQTSAHTTNTTRSGGASLPACRHKSKVSMTVHGQACRQRGNGPIPRRLSSKGGSLATLLLADCVN
eukprot:11944747-Alexandrium_andersonii.AAC.1